MPKVHKLSFEFLEELMIALMKARTENGLIVNIPPTKAFTPFILKQLPIELQKHLGVK